MSFTFHNNNLYVTIVISYHLEHFSFSNAIIIDYLSSCGFIYAVVNAHGIPFAGTERYLKISKFFTHHCGQCTHITIIELLESIDT